MATKRGDKSKHELVNLGYGSSSGIRDEFIERVVLPTDSLQGLALLYNTSVSELKKINQIHQEAELHARRVIKVPARGILVDLTEDAAIPVLNTAPSNDESDEESSNGQVYLENVDTVLKEIKEKAETVAANSPILNGSEGHLPASYIKTKKSEIPWWKIFLPCVAILILFPIVYFLFLEHMEHVHHFGAHNETSNVSAEEENSHAEKKVTNVPVSS